MSWWCVVAPYRLTLGSTGVCQIYDTELSALYQLAMTGLARASARHDLL